VSGSVESRADVLLGGRLGQAMLADLAGLDSLVLLAAEGKPPPAGVTFLESSSSSGLSALLRWSRRPRHAQRDAGTWPDWVNPGGDDAATITAAAVASAVQASSERPWFTDPLALLASVARAAEHWEPRPPGDQAELLRPLAETVASEVWAVGIDPAARVYEVHEPGDWGRLAGAHPRDVTASRRHDWSRWTGREGRWILPDWRSVAARWDGVQLPMMGRPLAPSPSTGRRKSACPRR
jgi:hypothetical protein